MKTLIKRADFDDPQKWGRVSGIVNFVNEVASSGAFKDEELDEGWPQAMGVYFVDYYIAQINNGGHLQFFLNSINALGINDSILRGIEQLGAEQNAEIFKQATAKFEEHRERILSFVETYDRNVFQEFDHLFDPLDRTFFPLNDYLYNLNFAQVEAIRDLHILDESQYSIELGKILDDGSRKKSL